MKKTLAILITCAGFAHGQSADLVAAQAQQNILNQQAVISQLLFEQDEIERKLRKCEGVYVPPPGNALDNFYEQRKQFFPFTYPH